MTEQRKQEIIEAIIYAFHSKNLKPMRGLYRDRKDGEECACAVGAVTTAGSGGGRCTQFEQIFQVSYPFVSGVLAGFDGHSRVGLDQVGYEVGVKVWELMTGESK